MTAAGGTAPAARGFCISNIFPTNKIPTSCFDPTAVGVYNHYVLPFQQQADPTTDQLISSGNRHLRTDQFTVRFDHSITPSQKFTAYYYFEDDDRTDPFSHFQAAGANLPGFDALFKTRVSAMESEPYLDHRLDGRQRISIQLFPRVAAKPEPSRCTPSLPCRILASPFRPPIVSRDPTNPRSELRRIFPVEWGFRLSMFREVLRSETISKANCRRPGTLSNGWTITRGPWVKHTVKFGADVRRQRFDQFLYFEVSGNYSFINQANGDQIAAVTTRTRIIFLARARFLSAGFGARRKCSQLGVISFRSGQLQSFEFAHAELRLAVGTEYSVLRSRQPHSNIPTGPGDDAVSMLHFRRRMRQI